MEGTDDELRSDLRTYLKVGSGAQPAFQRLTRGGSRTLELVTRELDGGSLSSRREVNALVLLGSLGMYWCHDRHTEIEVRLRRAMHSDDVGVRSTSLQMALALAESRRARGQPADGALRSDVVATLAAGVTDDARAQAEAFLFALDRDG